MASSEKRGVPECGFSVDGTKKGAIGWVKSIWQLQIVPIAAESTKYRSGSDYSGYYPIGMVGAFPAAKID